MYLKCVREDNGGPPPVHMGGCDSKLGPRLQVKAPTSLLPHPPHAASMISVGAIRVGDIWQEVIRPRPLVGTRAPGIVWLLHWAKYREKKEHRFLLIYYQGLFPPKC